MHHLITFCSGFGTISKAGDSTRARSGPLASSAILRNLLGSVLLMASFACIASAQLGSGGTIVGTITDPSGAAVPNVAITLTDVDTGDAHHVTCNELGQYVAPDLPIGHYTVKAEAPGFKASQQSGIDLTVGARDRVDIKLEIGNTQETVTVEATAVAVQSESGEVSDVINGQQVAQLSENGRSLYSLATLTPGASSNMVDFQNPTPVGGNATVSFNGLRVSHNLYMVDGGEDLDRGGSGNISIMPSIDAISEFRALTSNYSAEFGLSSGATFTMVFKSGAKDFHATGWEFFRNDALDAGNYFTNAAGKAPPELRFNTYGFNVGGPVFIPKLYNRSREKTFFFYNMEWRKLVTGGLVNQTVPLASEYGGQFPSSVPIHTPCTNQVTPSVASAYQAAGLQLSTPNGTACSGSGLVPFAGNRIPTSLINSNAAALLAAGIFPSPNNGSSFVGGNKLPTDVREEIVRIDHRFSDKFSIFGHWVSEQISQTYGTSLWSGDNVPSVGTLFGNPSYSGVVHATWSISPTLLNEVAFNYNGNRIAITPLGVVDRPSGVNIPELFPGNNLNRIPGIDLSGSTGTNYDVSSWPWHNKADDYQVRDDISWVKGAHQIKIGASWMLYKKIQDLFGDTQGQFNFNGNYTGNDFADFLLGDATSYTELAVQDAGHWDNQSYDAYIQDDWKVNSRLTLNLGLRWDGIPHTYEENNRQSNFYPGLYNPANAAQIVGSVISPSSPGLGTSPNPILNGHQFYLNGIGIAGQNGIPAGLVKNDWALFAPRLGFAYDLTGQGKTVLRGGFGIMYERIQGNDVYNAGPNIPFSSSVTLNNVSLSNPALSLASGQTLSAPITAASITGLAYTDYKNPASFQYSFGIQHQFWANTVLGVSYVGNENDHQNDYRNINLPDPGTLGSLESNPSQYNSLVPYRGFNSIVLSEDAENSNYNALQIDFHSQVRNDLFLQFAYTWSKSMDPATGNGGSGDLSYVSDPYNRAYDYGPSGLDREHIALVNFVYTLPVFKNTDNHVLKTTLGGWQVSGIATMETGLPLFVTLSGSESGNGIPNATNRPNVSGPITYADTVASWFNSGAFSQPGPGAWGNLGKNALRAPGRDNWNLSLFKNFVISEARDSRFELRFETFNTFNHTQFDNIGTSYPSTQFGQVTSTWDPRVIQLGAKLYF
jgi:hypothetical protein